MNKNILKLDRIVYCGFSKDEEILRLAKKCKKENKVLVAIVATTKNYGSALQEAIFILDDRIWNTNYIGLEKEEDRIELVKENDWSLLEHKKEKGLITYFEKYDYTINYLNEKYNPSELRVVPNLDWENSAHWGFNYFLIEK